MICNGTDPAQHLTSTCHGNGISRRFFKGDFLTMVGLCMSPKENCLLWPTVRLSLPDQESPWPSSCCCCLHMKRTILPNISGTPSVRPDSSPFILERYQIMWSQDCETEKTKRKKIANKSRRVGKSNANVPVTRAQKTRQPSE